MACRKPLLFYDSGVALIDSRKGVTDRIVTLLGEPGEIAGRTVASGDRPPAAELYLHCGGILEEEDG